MTIYPVSFAMPNVALACDLCNWSGVVALSVITFGVKPNGTADPKLVVLPCGNCGAVTIHPIGGGAHPRAVQALFILKLVQATSLTFAQAAALVRAAAEGEAPGRFQWGQAASATDLTV